MARRRLITCPECGAVLEEGYLSSCSGSVWHPARPRGWKRVVWSAFSTGRRVFGNQSRLPLVSSVPASRCAACGTVVISGSAAA